ncbi:XRE family transcriptional regulator [Hylemonella gracilis str. Niagara R]|uniref:XRE family transcriptional regulator n=1 Tax=Hylemonella gracilis str. Niagara R TaxID=1458275 RepID=A0A016XLA2_9BURK|nr:helix-turn-helix transcriptional regulator [Hylemonella gracilis]EYC52675.1 XRE family transcriptional regulator [Hylemonella gracilis str. Niagara R]
MDERVTDTQAGIKANTGADRKDNALGNYLRNRRTRLDPAAFGFAGARRRTPGLRREEVAQLAHISQTWYTCLEQGRGGPPSGEVLDRIARALMLTEGEREHLFLLGLGRAPARPVPPGAADASAVSPRLQRLLDALPWSPAYIKTLTWDLVAWNRAADIVFDYGALPPGQRNILRRIFLDPATRAKQFDWDSVARYVVAAFRADAARATWAAAEVQALVDELCGASADFAALWQAHDVHVQGEGSKRLRHPQVGTLSLEYSSFSVEGRPDLGMVVFNPVGAQDQARLRALLDRAAMQEQPHTPAWPTDAQEPTQHTP